MAADQCPGCAVPVGVDDHYCEACGQDLGGSTVGGSAVGGSVVGSSAAGGSASGGSASGRSAVGGSAVAVTRRSGGGWLSSSGPPGTCAGCAGNSFSTEGYCDTCGRRRPAAENHSELDLASIAAVSDRGLRHHANEDAVGLARVGRTSVAIVCDGVSTSTRPDEASHGAVDAAVPALLVALGRHTDAAATGGEAVSSRDVAAAAIDAATRAGQAAAALVAGALPDANPPSTTFVCAVVDADSVTVGWVGDSRAYWLPDGGGAAVCLTVDDAINGALLRWLGVDAGDTTPHLRHFAPPGPGRVLVCSDGLYRYRPDPAELAAAVPAQAPLATAQALVKLALDAGGQDNVTVAILTYPTSEPTAPELPTPDLPN